MVQVGSIVGSYRVVTPLGEGGMGTVFIAEHTLLGRRAAIKVLQAGRVHGPDAIDRFFREAQTASALADPGIVQVFDFGYHLDGSAYILMELLDGEPLDVRLRRVGRLAPAAALRIVGQLASSLAAAHARGIVHRDLKPENVVLVADAAVAGGERTKIVDFGIAKLLGRPGDDPVMGTPLYMSPEQCRGSARLDHRSDIYALGCLLFHLLVGRPPFEGDTAADVIARHLLEPPPVPSTRVSSLPPDLDALVLCCLAKSPDARYQDMSELIAGVGLALPLVQGRARPLATRPVARAAAETTLVSCPPTGPAPITIVGPEQPASGVPRPAPRTWLAMLLAALALVTTATVTAAGVAGARNPGTGADPIPAAAVSASRQTPSCTGVDGALPRRRAARMPRRQPRSRSLTGTHN